MLSSNRTVALSNLPVPSDTHSLLWIADPLFRVREHAPYTGNAINPELVKERFDIIREKHKRAWRRAFDRIALAEAGAFAIAFLAAPAVVAQVGPAVIISALIGLTLAAPTLLEKVKLLEADFMRAAKAEAKATELWPEEYDMVVGLVSRRQELLPYATSWLARAGRLTDIELDLLIEADEMFEAKASRSMHPRRKTEASLKRIANP